MRRFIPWILLGALFTVVVIGWALTSGWMVQPAGETPPVNAAAPSVPEPPEPAPSPGPDLGGFAAPQELTLPDVAAMLAEYLNAGEGPPAPRLQALFDHWGLQAAPGASLLAEADLNGDGATELATLLHGLDEAKQELEAALFIIYRDGERYRVDHGEGVRQFGPSRGGALHGVVDLTGDGRNEIVWSSTQTGAHTSNSTVLVSVWKPGQLQRLPSAMEISMMDLQIQGRDLRLNGGTIGSAGAGMAQRRRTDTYRWVDGSFALVDRQYAPSDYAYHRLLDGIVAEEFGRLADAKLAFRQAMEPGREALRAGDMVPEEWESRFADAVQALAGARSALLLIDEDRVSEVKPVSGRYAELVEALAGAQDRGAACAAVEAYAQAEPEFIEALNSPLGYANPSWQPQDLCGPLPPVF